MRVLLSWSPWEYVFPILLSLRLPSSGVWTLPFIWWFWPCKSGSGNVVWIACVFQFVWFQLVTHSMSLCVCVCMCVWIFLHKNTSKNYIIMQASSCLLFWISIGIIGCVVSRYLSFISSDTCILHRTFRTGRRSYIWGMVVVKCLGCINLLAPEFYI